MLKETFPNSFCEAGITLKTKLDKDTRKGNYQPMCFMNSDAKILGKTSLATHGRDCTSRPRLRPVIPATRVAEAGESLEARRQRLQ